MRPCLLLPMLLALSPLARAADTPTTDILVHGQTTPGSAWNRAETDHLIVLSDGSEAELRRVTAHLERLDQLLTRLYRHGAPEEGGQKLTVTLLGSRSALRDLQLADLRAREGPYGAGLTEQRYYDPREDGAVLALARADQAIDLDTSAARDRDCEEKMAEDNDCVGMTSIHHPPAVRGWEGVLASAYAQHFILSAMPAAYPRWYLDGVGALFSTLNVRGDGALDYAQPPLDYRLVLRAYGQVNIGDVVTGRYLAPGYGPMVWTPYHAWLVADFFLYARLKPERQRQFAAYMAAIAHGTPMEQAAAVFGNLHGLQRDFEVYLERPMTYARTDRQKGKMPEPLVTNLSPAQAALVEARIMAGEAGDHTPDWRAKLRDRLAHAPGSPDAALLRAEVACRGGEVDLCLAEADRLLAATPDNPAALAWKGMAQVDLAMVLPADQRPAALTAARSTIARAMQADGQASLPTLALFRSFARAGEPVPDAAMIGLARLARAAPAAPLPRLWLAQELTRQGKDALALSVIAPVLGGGYDSPEKALAAASIHGVTQMR